MNATFWIFKDVNNGEPRVVVTDPTPLLPNHAEIPLTVKEGILFDTIVTQGVSFLRSMRGAQGDEGFLKVTIEENPGALAGLMGGGG